MKDSRSTSRHASRAAGGMTLLELLIAMSIMVMVVGMLGALAKGVQQGFEYTEGHGLATQHARVVLERITRRVREATANEKFPGVWVLEEVVEGTRFPDTLIVWHPGYESDGTRISPRNPNGWPCYDELVVYRPDDPGSPTALIEMQIKKGSTDPPAIDPIAEESQGTVDNDYMWDVVKVVEDVVSSDGDKPVTLTELMRSCLVQAQTRGAVRFETQLRPSEAQWQTYTDAAAAVKQSTWEGLPWVQGISGMRQVWLRVELQLMPGKAAAEGNNDGAEPIPFFGSAALYYGMDR